MRIICPECLTKVSSDEIKRKRCHCGYKIESKEELLTMEEAMNVHDNTNSYKEKFPYMEELVAIRKDIHCIAVLIQIWFMATIIGAFIFCIKFL